MGFGARTAYPWNVAATARAQGSVHTIDIFVDHHKRTYCDYAFVYYDRLEDAAHVVATYGACGLFIDGMQVRVEFAAADYARHRAESLEFIARQASMFEVEWPRVSTSAVAPAQRALPQRVRAQP